jgi:hypothetical protein
MNDDREVLDLDLTVLLKLGYGIGNREIGRQV